MATIQQIEHAVNSVGLASDCLVEVIQLMRKLSSASYSTERDQIILQVGRLQILSDRINNEVPTP